MKGKRQPMTRGKASARSRIDVGRLAAAASRPGIDPRLWVSLAIVKKVSFDSEEGIFVDVKLVPSGAPETCFLGSGYAGGGFGDHAPVRELDTVLVAFPGGQPGYGGVIISRFNDAADPPHEDFDSNDRVVRAEPGQNIRLVVSAGAQLQIVAEAGSIVQLGADDVVPGLQGVVNGEAFDTFTGLTQALLGNASLTVAAKKGPP